METGRSSIDKNNVETLQRIILELNVELSNYKDEVDGWVNEYQKVLDELHKVLKETKVVRGEK